MKRILSLYLLLSSFYVFGQNPSLTITFEDKYNNSFDTLAEHVNAGLLKWYNPASILPCQHTSIVILASNWCIYSAWYADNQWLLLSPTGAIILDEKQIIAWRPVSIKS